MQKVEISCRSRRPVYTNLSPEEEIDRLQEIEREKTRQAVEVRKTLKRQLLVALTELREMRQNRDIFSDEDLAEKQAEIDKLKARL